MGILSSLFAGASGLNAHGTLLGIIGNNIANLSTVGFKSSRATFADLISSSLAGGSSTNQTGIGVAVTAVQGNFTQGSLSSTSNVLDLAIDGNGFYVMRNQAGAGFYTRAGQFRLDSTNRIVDPNGFLLQGYQANTAGVISGAVGTITLPSTTASPNPTANVSIGANLNSQEVVNTFNITDPTGTSNYSTSMTLYDSLGNGHLITSYFSKTAANTWTYNVVGLASEINTASYNAANIDTTLGIVRLASGTLGFTTNGALNTASVATSYNNGTVGGAAGATAGELQINFLGATPAQLMTFDFGTPIAGGGTGLNGTTQFGSPSALVRQTQDGYAAGSLEGFSVDASGIVSGRFSNGQVRALAQVALARFPDPIGLVRTGKNMFAESGTSGQPIVGAPDTAGLGRILGNSLELSNVDLGESFIELITAQRGFQANSRVITTSDEVLQELVNLKR